MATSDKCKTKGKRKMCTEKKVEQKASRSRHFSQHITNKARALRPPIAPTAEPLPPVSEANALPRAAFVKS